MIAANRESAMFEQALTVYQRKPSLNDEEEIEQDDTQYNQALSRMLGLTNSVRDELIARRLRHSKSEN